MRIVFEREGTTLFAVAYDEIRHGYLHEELMFAEIDEALGSYMVRFEDSWSDPIHCDTLEEAKNIVLRDYNKHTPRSMGRNYYLK